MLGVSPPQEHKYTSTQVHKYTSTQVQRSRAFLRSTVHPDNLAAQIVSLLYITPNLASNKLSIYS